MSIDDMDTFEQKKMKKERPIKNTWYHWLINYIPEAIRIIVGSFKDKVVSFFMTNTPKDYDKKPGMGEETNQANQKHKNNVKLT